MKYVETLQTQPLKLKNTDSYSDAKPIQWMCNRKCFLKKIIQNGKSYIGTEYVGGTSVPEIATAFSMSNTKSNF